ncbi:MAG: hypothetical protein GY816_12675 [Cytophagales bacterium]|nr:hypothetical protein [Cytophagales bacterium]
MHTRLLRFQRARSKNKSHYLSDEEIEDLDIDKFFFDLSPCITPWGHQYFFLQLCMRSVSNKKSYSLSNDDHMLAYKILSKNKQQRNYDLIEFIKNPIEYTSYLNNRRILYSFLLTVNIISALLATFSWVGLVLFSLISLVNSTLHFINKYEQAKLLDGLKNIESLSNCLKDFEKGKIIKEHLSNDISFGYGAFLLRLELKNPFANEFSAVFFHLIEFFKSIFLLDYFLAVLLLKKVDFTLLNDCYETCALIDYSTSCHRRQPNTSIVKNLSKSSSFLDVNKVIHPGIDHPVGNSLIIKNNIVLTGSNASGKSTFLRSLAINALLANSVGYTFSKSWRSTNFCTHSIICKRDNTLFGLSLFQNELKRLHLSIQNVQSNKKLNHLLFFDEILSGTNDTERNILILSTVKFFLPFTNVKIIISTHDLILANKLVDLDFESYYFRHSYKGKKLVFDYKLLNGLSESTNALELLSTCSFPDSFLKIVQDTACSST